jgi:hypothetical protein
MVSVMMLAEKGQDAKGVTLNAQSNKTACSAQGHHFSPLSVSSVSGEKTMGAVFEGFREPGVPLRERG